jgi:diguanylate cyclase (GGDEF)-like protein/PAS domain S-box-containing protein
LTEKPDGNISAIKAEQVRVLFASIPATSISGTFLAAMLAYVLKGVVVNAVLAGWLVLVVAVAAVRGGLLVLHRRAPPDDANSDIRLKRFRLSVLFSGVVWGLAGWLLFPPNDVIHQTLLAFVLAGLAAGATTAFSFDMPCIIAFLLPELVPFILRLFMEGGDIPRVMGIAVIVFIGYMVSTTRPANRRFRENILLRIEAVEREQALHASEERFRHMFERHDSVMLLIDPSSGAIMNANAAASRFYGYTIERLCEMNIAEIDIPKPGDIAAANRQVDYGDGKPFVFSHRLAGGEVRTVEMHSSPVEVADRTHLFSIIYDVTDRVIAEAGLHLQDAALNASANAIVITDKDGLIKWANQAFTDLTGYRLDEAAGRALKELESGPQSKGCSEALWQTILSGHAWRGELVNQRKDGSPYHEEITITPVRDGNNEINNFVAVKQDISERKNVERQIHNLAFYDTLTQLPNRRLLLERLELALAAGRRTRLYGALMFMDLDNFKSVNDTHGHDLGDLLLVEAGRRLARCVRAEDTVARLGGDEFVLMLERLNVDKAISTANAGMVAEKVRASLSKPYLLQRRQSGGGDGAVEHHCTASIGIAVFNHEESKEDILKWADTAMYQAKSSGRNKCKVFDLSA